jgi:hypothetical protein
LLVALCKTRFDQDPFSGTLFVFRNRSGTALKLLVYDGQGYSLCLKRFSKGRLHWWSQPSDASAASVGSPTTEESGDASSEKGLFIAKIEFSVRSGMAKIFPWNNVSLRRPSTKEVCSKAFPLTLG